MRAGARKTDPGVDDVLASGVAKDIEGLCVSTDMGVPCSGEGGCGGAGSACGGAAAGAAVLVLEATLVALIALIAFVTLVSLIALVSIVVGGGEPSESLGGWNGGVIASIIGLVETAEEVGESAPTSVSSLSGGQHGASACGHEADRSSCVDPGRHTPLFNSSKYKFKGAN